MWYNTCYFIDAFWLQKCPITTAKKGAPTRDGRQLLSSLQSLCICRSCSQNRRSQNRKVRWNRKGLCMFMQSLPKAMHTEKSAYQKHTKNAIVMIGKEAVRILTRMITNWTAYGQVWPEYGTNPLTAFNWRQVSASRKDFSLLRWSNAVALYSFKEGNASHKNGNWSTLMLEIKNPFRIHVQFCTFMYSFKEGNASHKNGSWSTLMLSSFGNRESFQNICTRDPLK